MYFTNRRVLVTGSTGLIGVNLLERLRSSGAIVRATYRHRPAILTDRRIEYVSCDLTRPEDCERACEGMELVFHCAAVSSGAMVVTKTPMVHVTPNVVMNAYLLEAAYRAGIKKFLWLSSTTIYPPSGERPVREDEPLTADPHEKAWFSGQSKRFGEVLARMYGEKLSPPMAVIVLRPTNVYGPHDDFEFETAHVVPALVRKVAERHDPVIVWGTGQEVRDLLYVGDLVEAMLLAMEKVLRFDVFNIGSGTATSVQQLLDRILDLDSYGNARVEFDPAAPTTFPIRLVDTSKAEQHLGFRATTDLGEGLKRTISWYRALRSGSVER